MKRFLKWLRIKPFKVKNKQEGFYEALVKALPCHVYWKDSDGTILGCNDEQAQCLGADTMSGIVGKKNHDFLSSEEADEIYAIDSDILKENISRVIEEVVTDRAGDKKIYLSKKIPFSYGGEKNVVGVSIDVTEHRKREEKIKDEREKVERTLDNIIANLPGHVYWKDKDFVYQGIVDPKIETVV